MGGAEPEVAVLREKLGLAPGPSPLHWRESLPYVGFAISRGKLQYGNTNPLKWAGPSRLKQPSR